MLNRFLPCLLKRAFIQDVYNLIIILGNADLLTEEFEPDETEKDDLTLLNEILNAPSTGEDDFSREWQAVFGDSPLNPVAMPTPAEPDKPKTGATFMPSNLLDLGGQMTNMNLNQGKKEFLNCIKSTYHGLTEPQ